VLRYPLIHPQLLAVLAAAGHGSKILIADGNYAHRTNTHALAPVIHLNLRPGLVTVEHVLETVVDASPVEAATLMLPDDGSPSPVQERYRGLLGEAVPMRLVGRGAFYQACRRSDMAATIATGDQRHYANVLLTVGALPAPGPGTPAADEETGRTAADMTP
jgi:L-fucose mutarotase